MKQAQMAAGAAKLVNVCANVQPGEEALIITDMAQDFSLAQALATALSAAGALPMIMITLGHET